MEKIEVLGVQVNTELKSTILREISLYYDQKDTPEPRYVVTPYSEFFVEAQSNQRFRDALNQSWIALPDGIGVIWAGFYLVSKRGLVDFLTSIAFTLTGRIIFHSPFAAKISGSDIVYDLLELAEQKELSVMFVGSQDGTQKDAKTFVESIYPGVRVITGYTGIFDDQSVPQEVRESIGRYQPDMIFAALSYPRQEIFLQNLTKEIPGQYLAFGLGGTISFMAQQQKRAPVWMQKIGLEWLYRLIREPSRIGRMYKAVVTFPKLVLRSLQ